MSQQFINVGAAPNDHTGDFLRESQIKANANFTELYGVIPGAVGAAGTIKLFLRGFCDGVANDPTSTDILPGDMAVWLDVSGNFNFGVYQFGSTDTQVPANYEIVIPSGYTPVTS